MKKEFVYYIKQMQRLRNRCAINDVAPSSTKTFFFRHLASGTRGWPRSAWPTWHRSGPVEGRVSCVTATFREDEPRPAVRLCAGATSILFRVAPTIALVRLCTQARRKYTRAVLLGLGNILDRERVWPNFFKSEVKPSPLSRSRGVHAIFTFPPRAGWQGWRTGGGCKASEFCGVKDSTTTVKFGRSRRRCCHGFLSWRWLGTRGVPQTNIWVSGVHHGVVSLCRWLCSSHGGVTRCQLKNCDNVWIMDCRDPVVCLSSLITGNVNRLFVYIQFLK